jgi:hypothetical protein
VLAHERAERERRKERRPATSRREVVAEGERGQDSATKERRGPAGPLENDPSVVDGKAVEGRRLVD